VSLYKEAKIFVAGFLVPVPMHYYDDGGFGGVEVKLHNYFTTALQVNDKRLSWPVCFMHKPNFDRRLGEL
jgi:hypothetical protein